MSQATMPGPVVLAACLLPFAVMALLLYVDELAEWIERRRVERAERRTMRQHARMRRALRQPSLTVGEKR